MNIKIDIEKDIGDIKMNMFNKLPHFVILNNEKYFINTDFRIFIDFEKKMQGRNTREASLEALQSFYPAFFLILERNILKEAVDKFIWFYRCGKEETQIKNETKRGKNLRIYDYDYDSDLIWGAFWDRGIDLSRQKVHWWKFRAIWNSLSSECEFNRIRGYRAYEGNDKDLLKKKDFYKLPPSEFEIDEQKRRKEIIKQLKQLETSQE